MADVYAKADEMIDRFKDTIDVAKQLQEGFDLQSLYTGTLKKSFEDFKEAVDSIKSRISGIFGQKFHEKFPDERRECEDKCGCGYFPTDPDRYGHPGVDLRLTQSWKAIGTPTGNNGCDESHINVAMMRKGQNCSAGPCAYIDPSPFLDRMQPVPKWHQECKDFTFRHIGLVIDFDKLTEGFKEVLKDLKRMAVDFGKQLLMKAVDALPDTGFLGRMKSIAGNIVSGIDLDAGNLKNLFQDGV
nr:hypothetical protein BaRGS_031109 [Batillaria attramentaria]